MVCFWLFFFLHFLNRFITGLSGAAPLCNTLLKCSASQPWSRLLLSLDVDRSAYCMKQTSESSFYAKPSELFKAPAQFRTSLDWEPPQVQSINTYAAFWNEKVCRHDFVQKQICTDRRWNASSAEYTLLPWTPKPLYGIIAEAYIHFFWPIDKEARKQKRENLG